MFSRINSEDKWYSPYFERREFFWDHYLYRIVKYHLNEDEIKFKKIEEKSELIVRLLSTPSLFPQKPSGRVKYAMALANLILSGSDESPSKENQIRISDNMPKGFARYLWTAFMVFGENLPNISFDHEALSISGSSHIYNQLFFNAEVELGGFFFTFSDSSLYKTVFKHHLKDDMLILTDNPEFFEGISSQSYRSVEAQIESRMQKIAEEQQNENLKKQAVTELINNPSLFPKDPAGKVKFAMALASLTLVNIEPPTKDTPIVMRNIYVNFELFKYLWTAFMVFGKNLPYGSFDNHALKVITAQWDPGSELGGFWSDFSKKSVYETVFKHHLKPEMFVLAENPEFFEGISNQLYKTVTEQIRAQKEGPYKQVTKMLEEAQRVAERRPQQETLNEPIISPQRPAIQTREERGQTELELAQRLEESNPNDFNQVFSSYLHAARTGRHEALAPLERLGQEANKDQQLALSQLYGAFFSNSEKATYWSQKAMEISQPAFEIQF